MEFATLWLRIGIAGAIGYLISAVIYLVLWFSLVITEPPSMFLMIFPCNRERARVKDLELA
jgi:hypothetical protein